MSTLLKIITSVPPLVFSVVIHEIAHGYTAWKLGDPTARALGRLSLNPLKHIDMLLTIIIPGLLILSGSPIIFGGAKPVPVDSRYFKNPRRDMAYVAIAGPLSNFVLAILFFYLTNFLTDYGNYIPLPSSLISLLLIWSAYGVLINLVLGLFNLLPVPPLDGGRIMVGILPYELAVKWAKLERYGLLIVILLLYSGIVDKFLSPVIELVAKYLLN